MNLLADTFQKFEVKAFDGITGTLNDFYFDYSSWRLTHISVLWQKSFFSKSYCSLVPAENISAFDIEKSIVDVNILKQQIRNGPQISNNKPISSGYYEKYWNDYYSVPDRPRPIQFIGSLARPPQEPKEKVKQKIMYYPLRSINGYRVSGFDGKMGRSYGAIVNIEKLFIKSIVYKDFSSFLPKKKELGIEWLRKIDWKNREMYFEIHKDGNMTQFSPTDKSAHLTPNIISDYNGDTKIAPDVHKISPTS